MNTIYWSCLWSDKVKDVFLKRLSDCDEQKSDPILFQDFIASGKKLFLNLEVVHNISCSLVSLSFLGISLEIAGAYYRDKLESYGCGSYIIE